MSLQSQEPQLQSVVRNGALLFSEEKMAGYSLSSCMYHTRGETAFRQDEDNVESFSSSGSVLLILAIRAFLQRLPGCC